jgi:hypothetical protein
VVRESTAENKLQHVYFSFSKYFLFTPSSCYDHKCFEQESFAVLSIEIGKRAPKGQKDTIIKKRKTKVNKEAIKKHLLRMYLKF